MGKRKVLAEDLDKAQPVFMCTGSWREPKQCSGVLYQFSDQSSDEKYGAFIDKMINNFNPY